MKIFIFTVCVKTFFRKVTQNTTIIFVALSELELSMSYYLVMASLYLCIVSFAL